MEQGRQRRDPSKARQIEGTIEMVESERNFWHVKQGKGREKTEEMLLKISMLFVDIWRIIIIFWKRLLLCSLVSSRIYSDFALDLDTLVVWV
jgi:hypothetical protein